MLTTILRRIEDSRESYQNRNHDIPLQAVEDAIRDVVHYQDEALSNMLLSLAQYATRTTGGKFYNLEDVAGILARLLPKKQVLHIDMDGVLVYWGKEFIAEEKQEIGFYRNLPAYDGAVEAFHKLCKIYDVYIASSPSWSQLHSWSEKRQWVADHLGEYATKRLILTHNKGLLRGDYIIDDTDNNGVMWFQGEHLHFMKESYMDWDWVLKQLA